MLKPYGFAHFVEDLASGRPLSQREAQVKLRRCAGYEKVPVSDVREWLCIHFRSEPEVEKILRNHSPEVLDLTGLDALVEAFGQDGGANAQF